ncbi:hypothetical protein V8C86DRAFT_2658868 [Haematococcus lacustris]
MTLDEEVQAAADNRDLEGLLALLGASRMQALLDLLPSQADPSYSPHSLTPPLTPSPALTTHTPTWSTHFLDQTSGQQGASQPTGQTGDSASQHPHVSGLQAPSAWLQGHPEQHRFEHHTTEHGQAAAGQGHEKRQSHPLHSPHHALDPAGVPTPAGAGIRTHHLIKAAAREHMDLRQRAWACRATAAAAASPASWLEAPGHTSHTACSPPYPTTRPREGQTAAGRRGCRSADTSQGPAPDPLEGVEGGVTFKNPGLPQAAAPHLQTLLVAQRRHVQQLGRVLEGSGVLKGQGLEGAGQLVAMLQQGYDLEEALKGQLAEAEQEVGVGASAGSRRAALFLATQLREELGQLMRSNRVLRRLVATTALQPGSIRAEGAAAPPPPTSHTPTGKSGAQLAPPQWQAQGADQAQTPWRPVRVHPSSPLHPPGWTSVGDYLEAQPLREYAQLRSLKVDDLKLQLRKRREWVAALAQMQLAGVRGQLQTHRL